MREIKFRAWDKQGKYFIDTDDHYIALDGKFYSDAGWDGIRWEDSDRYVFMQFTGMYDREGKEIYEGDIIKSTWYGDWCDLISQVYWEKECHAFAFMPNHNDKSDLLLDVVECTVIGNIYEHSYLLNQDDGRRRPE